jgi:hypothetical protein
LYVDHASKKGIIYHPALRLSQAYVASSFQASVCFLIQSPAYLDSNPSNSRQSTLSHHSRTKPSMPCAYPDRPLNTTHYIRSLFRRSSRLALPRKRPPPLEHVYCLLRRATLFFFFAVDACSSGGETDRDGEEGIEGSDSQGLACYSCTGGLPDVL